MRVMSRARLVDFWRKHPDARGPLENWFRITRRAKWVNFPSVRATFGHADQSAVGSGNTVVIFDVGGNKYRLIARISYNKGIVYVLRILTHKEYDKNAWKEQL